MSKHRVRLHKWENGILNSVNHFFESLEDAIAFAGTADAHGVKIYNSDGELISAVTMSVPANTSDNGS
jgi:hypothetical protein